MLGGSCARICLWGQSQSIQKEACTCLTFLKNYWLIFFNIGGNSYLNLIANLGVNLVILCLITAFGRAPGIGWRLKLKGSGGGELLLPRDGSAEGLLCNHQTNHLTSLLSVIEGQALLFETLFDPPELAEGLRVLLSSCVVKESTELILVNHCNWK